MAKPITLNISTDKITKDDIAAYLRDAKTEAIITDNLSVCSKDNKYVVEKGIYILFPLATFECVMIIWRRLKEKYALTCAFIESDKFSGCILNAENYNI